MIDWFATAIVLLLGWMVMILGLLPYVFISFLSFLVLSIISEFLLHFINVFYGDEKKFAYKKYETVSGRLV